MRVIVFGAAGRIGGHLVRQAVARGHEVTAFVRRPARSGVREVVGDVRDVRAVEGAIRGHDAVLSALGHSDRRRVDGLYSTAARHFVEAMPRAGVERVISVSAWVEDSLPRAGFLFERILLPLVFRHIWEDLTIAEGVYRASSLRWTCVRASRLTDAAQRGNYREGHDLRGYFFSSISRADVAAFMLRVLEEDSYVRESPMIVD
jgi:putative NADH-flavin reductase